jgi:Tol biopolymer transport system component
MAAQGPRTPKDDDRLDSWKEIAAYVGRDTRTVARWEKSEGFPIHRHAHQKKHTVYAFKHEIDAWRQARSSTAENEVQGHALRGRGLPPRWLLLTAFAIALVLAALSLLPTTTGERPREVASTAAGRMVKKVFAESTVAESCYVTDVTRAGDFLGCFDESSGNVGVIDVASGRLRLLTERGSWEGAELATSGPLFSRNGESVAYTWRSRGSGLVELRVTDLYGGTRSIFQADGIDTEPLAWSPNRLWIATVLERRGGPWELVLISADDGTVRNLLNRNGARPRDADFSPDGRYLVFDNPSAPGGLSDLYLLDVETGTTRRLTEHPREDRFPIWIQDGRGLFFISDRTGVVDAWVLPMLEDGPAGPPRLSQRDLGAVFPVALTDDNSLYYHLQVGLIDIHTAEVDLETGTLVTSPRPFPTTLSGTNTQLVWSPDGTEAAWVSKRGWARRWTVVVRDLESGEERAFGNLRYARKPEWSPDGQTLLVRGTDALDRAGTFALDANSGAVIDLVLSGMQKTAEWADGGDAIVYSDTDERRGTGGIYLTRPGQDSVASLYTTEPGSAIGRLFAVSRTAHKVAFTLIHRPTQTRRLMVMGSRGGPASELFRVHEPAWIQVQDFSADGRFVLFMQHKKGITQLYRASVDGGEAVPIDLGVEDARSVSVHPSGGRIAFTTGRANVDLYVMANTVPASIGTLLPK